MVLNWGPFILKGTFGTVWGHARVENGECCRQLMSRAQGQPRPQQKLFRPTPSVVPLLRTSCGPCVGWKKNFQTHSRGKGRSIYWGKRHRQGSGTTSCWSGRATARGHDHVCLYGPGRGEWSQESPTDLRISCGESGLMIHWLVGWGHITSL